MFVSLASTTCAVPSAQASTKYVPVAVPNGIVTTALPVVNTPGPSAPIPRLPITTSSALRTPSTDSTYWVVVAPTVTGPTFWVVSVIRKLPPGTTATAGSLTDVTARSAVGSVRFVVWIDAAQLLASFVSLTTPRSSAHASR